MNTLPTSLDRHKRITLLFLKHSALRDSPPGEANSRSLARDIEDLGGPFVRAAKSLAVRSDLLPAPLLDAFSALDERHFSEEYLAEEPLEVIQQVLEDELGKKIPRAFASFHPEPCGFAGIGQIHHATLHDGRRVLVRIQRPRLRQRIVKDLDTLAEIASFIDHPDGRTPGCFSHLIDRLRVSLLRELDYRREETALVGLRENLGDRKRIRVPLVLHDFSSTRVLTTEFIDGTEIWEVPSSRTGGHGRELAGQFLGCYLDQLLVHGHLHPQPHLENLLITPGGRLVVTEASGSEHLGKTTLLLIRHLLSGLCLRDGISVGEALLRIGRTENSESVALNDALTDDLHSALGIGPLHERFLSVARTAALHGRPLSPALCRIADLFSNLSTASSAICPHFDSENFIHNHIIRLVSGSAGNTIRFPSPSAA